MREILFRGKRVDNGEWVEGSLITLDADSGYYFISEPYTGASTLPVRNLIFDHTHLVKAETICQYTGLTDKNGQKIWENDIIRHYNISWEPEKYYIGIVRWNGVDCRLENVFKDARFAMNHGCKYEVIGNVFDNAELLKE